MRRVVLIAADTLKRLGCFIANEPSLHCALQKGRSHSASLMS